ncbi:hypothetical protein [Streptomyces albidus (ex Kaewkla and Franco 2022)]|uniref:hypothetical protein n=1 Tax=Streptomyces albidus (ex Kaewkla and Franco 2022) TaxID=722709 RepID=UPI0015EECAAA|nr:hypothetical protein [Streptomyces albidus (ex Kaewkla and Franco 2022)]
MKIKKSLAVLGASAALALGFGGVAAPSAQADSPYWGQARYTQTNLRTGSVQTGTAMESPGGIAMTPPVSSMSLRCWDAYMSGRVFAVSCSGVNWYVYTDCTNNRRYVVGALSGSKRVAIACPAGTRAVRGGAYGY